MWYNTHLGFRRVVGLDAGSGERLWFPSSGGFIQPTTYIGKRDAMRRRGVFEIQIRTGCHTFASYAKVCPTIQAGRHTLANNNGAKVWHPAIIFSSLASYESLQLFPAAKNCNLVLRQDGQKRCKTMRFRSAGDSSGQLGTVWDRRKSHKSMTERNLLF